MSTIISLYVDRSLQINNSRTELHRLSLKLRRTLARIIIKILILVVYHLFFRRMCGFV